jgi:1-acyl-sn-glycerol-3-phosphate acyltransferase
VRSLLSAFFWGYLALSLAVFWFAVLLPWSLITPFDRRRRFSHWYAYTWANHYLALSPFWNIHVENRELIDPRTTYVMCPNHQSISDIFVMFKLKVQFKWVSKHTVFYVPFLGWMMAMAGYVGIRRGDAASRARMMSECRAHLRRGSSIMLFPEGGRSHGEQMRPFKRGAFVLACESGAPVLPILIEGTRDALPRGTWVFQQRDKKLDVWVRVLAPIDPAAADHDPARLQRLVRETMTRELARFRAEKGSSPAAEAALAEPSPT